MQYLPEAAYLKYLERDERDELDVTAASRSRHVGERVQQVERLRRRHIDEPILKRQHAVAFGQLARDDVTAQRVQRARVVGGRHVHAPQQAPHAGDRHMLVGQVGEKLPRAEPGDDQHRIMTSHVTQLVGVRMYVYMCKYIRQ